MCNGCKSPGTPDLKLTKAMCAMDADERKFMDRKPYLSIIGSLMYLMLGSRPDLSYLENPGILHWRATKQCLRYLRETIDYGLRLGGLKWTGLKPNSHLQAYPDADFANSTEDRKSVAGYITKFCGSPISWSSQTEKTVALHTTEAEYMALSLLVQEVIHLRQMLKELKVKQKETTEVYVDNESTKKLATNLVFHDRSKHIDVRHHFIDVHRFPGVDNVADAFTKPFSRGLFEKHRASMGLMSREIFEAPQRNEGNQ
ncbi:polyprotein [Phytophthora megakarya]|uniref:Polyprotein n=1 Tax=Phytophthora megakarya TaxID=4795 RepID=A0A225X277_9STRA|nr:polyprotein [Phytophthora megakarya]